MSGGGYCTKTRVKVCCIRTVDEAQAAIAAGVDAIGFVAQRPPSPRTIPDGDIAAIIRQIPPSIATFLLTAEQTADAISAHIRGIQPSTIQLLHHLDPQESAKLADIEPAVRRVQVVHVEGCASLDLIPHYAPFVDAFLLDSGRPHASTPSYGGTGQRHDWSISARFVAESPLPVFLAGGLSASNAAEAIETIRPFGLDLCTGVRTDGCLDTGKLAHFMRAVRDADRWVHRPCE